MTTVTRIIHATLLRNWDAYVSPISTLPPEMLQHIFSLMNPTDLRNASFVSRCWGENVQASRKDILREQLDQVKQKIEDRDLSLPADRPIKEAMWSTLKLLIEKLQSKPDKTKDQLWEQCKNLEGNIFALAPILAKCDPEEITTFFEGDLANLESVEKSKPHRAWLAVALALRGRHRAAFTLFNIEGWSYGKPFDAFRLPVLWMGKAALSDGQLIHAYNCAYYIPTENDCKASLALFKKVLTFAEKSGQLSTLTGGQHPRDKRFIDRLKGIVNPELLISELIRENLPVEALDVIFFKKTRGNIRIEEIANQITTPEEKRKLKILFRQRYMPDAYVENCLQPMLRRGEIDYVIDCASEFLNWQGACGSMSDFDYDMSSTPPPSLLKLTKTLLDKKCLEEAVTLHRRLGFRLTVSESEGRLSIQEVRLNVVSPPPLHR